MSRSLRTHYVPIALLFIVLVIAAFLRLWQIGLIPPGFHFDEAFEGLEAWRILTDPTYRPIFLTGNFGVPPLNAYANAVSFALTRALGGEEGPAAMRTTAAIFGILGVLILYALGRELVKLDKRSQQLSTWLPLLAAASLAFMRWHLHFSRMGIEPVIVPLEWAAAMWLLLLSWRTGRWAAYIATGIVISASMYTYQGAWIIPALAALSAMLMLIDSWSDRQVMKARWMRHVTGLLVAGAVALLLVLPLVFFFRQHPDLLLLRPAQLAIVGETGSSADSSILTNIWATMKMFVPVAGFGDMDPRRNLPGAPALSIWQAIAFFMGLLVALIRIRRPAYSVVLVGLVGLLLPGVISEYAPHFHRVLGAAAPAAILCGIGLDWMWQRVGSLSGIKPSESGERGWTKLAATALVVTLLVGALVTTTRDYFTRWAALPDLYYAFDEGLWDMGRWTDERVSANPVYITPRGSEHATLAFAWRERLDAPQTLPVSFDGRYIFPLTDGVNEEQEEYAVIEHEDWRTPLLLPDVFPDADVRETFIDRQGNVYARAYARAAAMEPERLPTVESYQSIGDGIRLLGYDVLPEHVHAGESLYLQLHWRVDASPQHDWTVWVHVVDPVTGLVMAGHDSRPGADSLPTTRWQTGWRILDEYEVHLPDDLSPGEYDLEIGLYSDDSILPVADGALQLGSVVVE